MSNDAMVEGTTEYTGIPVINTIQSTVTLQGVESKNKTENETKKQHKHIKKRTSN